jgi:uncharacterized repeat protein (TIGR01451 family)
MTKRALFALFAIVILSNLPSLSFAQELRPDLMYCGSSSRMGANLYLGVGPLNEVSGCVPDANTQALLVSRSGTVAGNGAAWLAYLDAGGVIISEWRNAHIVHNEIYGTAYSEGAGFGDCSDNAMPSLKLNTDHGFWQANTGLTETPANVEGCGADLSAIVGGEGAVTALGGLVNTSTISFAIRPQGTGVFWLLEADWQDSSGSFTDDSRNFMGALISGASKGVLYRTSLDIGSSDFSVYDIASDTWTTLTPFDSSSQMATSTDSRLFGWNTTAGEIQEYDPGTDTWSLVQAAPPVSGINGNLEYRANGEWVYTQYNGATMYYTVAGVWQTLSLPFTANSVGDYDPATDTLVVGQLNTSFFHAIDMGTLAITPFTSDVAGNGERGRCGQIRNGRFYYQTHSNPLSYLDLSNNVAAPVDVGVATPSYASCAVSEVDGDLYIGPLNGTTLGRLSLLDSSLTPLTGHTNLGNHSSLTWVGSALIAVQLADLTISKSDSVDPVTAGNELAYTIRVDNIGTAAAENVVVTDTLPAGVTLVSTDGCSEDPMAVPTCNLGTIDAAGFAEYTVTVSVDSSTTGSITNTASVTTSSQESNPDNNSITEDTVVDTEADLSITKMASSDAMISGGNQTLEYTIEVSNAGPSDATNVVVTDILSSLAIFESTAGCQNDPVGVPDCQLGTIAVGSSASYIITVRLQRADGTLVNSVSVTSDVFDPNVENSSVEETIDITAIPIPTLGSLGLALMILLMGGFGWVSIRRV